MNPPTTKPVSVLFVCLGNICRSTMAEGVFRHLTHFGTPSQSPLIADIDSCGTGAYHAGDPPDSRTLSVLHEHGLTTYDHAARRVRVPEDFERFDYVIAMDEDNYIDLRDMVESERAKKKTRSALGEDALGKVHLFGEFGGKIAKEEIEDPYYGGRDGFMKAYEQVLRLGKGLLRHIEEEAGMGEGVEEKK